MDFVEIRLSSGDEQALLRLQETLHQAFPEMRFDRPRLGRSGDWVCDGHIDEARRRVRTLATKKKDDTLVGWFRSYPAIRQLLQQVLGTNHVSIRYLDRAMSHTAWHANVDRHIWDYRPSADDDQWS